MKTAMQELIEYLRSLAFTKCHLGMGDIMLTQGHIDELEEKFIEKEKEQIINAWNDKRMKVFLSDDTDEFIELEQNDGEEYYNETYNHTK